MTEIKEQYGDLLFGVRRSVRYHRRRELFLDRSASVIKTITAGAGAATIVTLLADDAPEWLTMFAAAATAIFSVADIVFMPERTARLHNELARDFIGLEQDMLRATPALSQDDIIGLEARRLAVEMREPPHLRVLNLMCHNDLVKAMGKATQHYVDLTWYQRGLAHFVDIWTSDLEKRDRETA